MKYFLSKLLTFAKCSDKTFLSDFKYKYPIRTDMKNNRSNIRYEEFPNLNNSFRLKLKRYASSLGSLRFKKEISLRDKLSQQIFIKIIEKLYFLNFGIFLETKIKYKVTG